MAAWSGAAGDLSLRGRIRSGASGTGRITLGAEHLRINRRIARQACSGRTGWSSAWKAARAADLRAAGLRAEDLRQGG